MYDILFVQEHWLFDNRLDVLNVSNDNHLFAFSDIDASHEILLGRGFGGVATFVKNIVLS